MTTAAACWVLSAVLPLQREELVLRAEELQLKYSQALENDVPKPLGKVTLVDPTEERIRGLPPPR